MVQNVVHRMEVARARKVGWAFIVTSVSVTMTNMEKIVNSHVSATKTLRIVAIRGLESAIVKLDGAAVCAIGHVHF